MYQSEWWLCGCNAKNALFCFVCTLMNNGEVDKAWTETGITDLKHLGEKVKKHRSSKKQLNLNVSFAVLGKLDIRNQLNSAYRESVEKHNDQIKQNRYILSKLIDGIKFCGIFELALRGRDETHDSTNPGIFRGLVNLMAELDTTLKSHIEKTNNRVFIGLSKTIQNELLDSIYAVCINLIKDEILEADYISILADETTDVASQSQLVFVVRYELKDHTADCISSIIINELEKLEINQNPKKILSQSYDGASVMSGRQNGVQAKIKEHYPKAQFIHCYAHQLNLIIEKAASAHSQGAFGAEE
ncbi:zinc finger MYM-type protein 1-like [Zophobas morio]|uniref:zinc finger MYM-type protein 1-like n=1 Tax=Zophobas morio TaxID=2755281 RepID=UPI003083EC9E